MRHPFVACGFKLNFPRLFLYRSEDPFQCLNVSTGLLFYYLPIRSLFLPRPRFFDFRLSRTTGSYLITLAISGLHLRRSVPRDRGNLIDDGRFAAEGDPQLERSIAELGEKDRDTY